MSRRQLANACTLEAVASIESLFAAAHVARRGKSRRPDVEDWWLRRESEILRLHEELRSGTWQPGGYRFFIIHEPKRREIAAAPFADRVVHHALCRLMAPVLERRFERRRHRLQRAGRFRRLSTAVFAWVQFSREGNTEGLRTAWASPPGPK